MATEVYVNSAWVSEDAFNADASKPEGLVWGETAYGTLDPLFAKSEMSGDITVHLLSDVTAENKVDVSYARDEKYNFVTDLADAKITFKFADNWNSLPKFSIGQNVIMDVPYLSVIGGDVSVSGTINSNYLYLYGTGEGVTVEETGVLNINVAEDKTIQVKGGTVFTVKGTVKTNTLNVWTQDNNCSKLIVSGDKASIDTNQLHAWNGNGSTPQTVLVEDGASIVSDNFQADRGSQVTIDDATVDAKTVGFGYGQNVGTLEMKNNAKLEVETTLTVSENSLISMDTTSSVTTDTFTNNGEVSIDIPEGFSGSLDCIKANTYSEESTGTCVVTGAEGFAAVVENGSVYVAETDAEKADMSKIFINYAWEGSAENALVGVGKIFGVNAFSNTADMQLSAKTTEIVFTAGNEVSYGNLSVQQNVTLVSSGDGVVKLSRFDDDAHASPEANTVTIAEGSKFLFSDYNVLRPEDTLNINGELTFSNTAVYGKSTVVVGSTGSLIYDDCNIQNTVKPMTVYGSVKITDTEEGGFVNVKLAGNENGASGSLIVDGSKGDGVVEIDAPSFSFGGGYGGGGWGDGGADCSVTVRNGGIITSNAYAFRNGKNCTITLNKGQFLFTEVNKNAAHSTVGTTFENQGVINAVDSTINMTGRDFSNTGTFTVSGASTINVGSVIKGSNAIEIFDAEISDSTIGGKVNITGDTTFTGTNVFSGLSDSARVDDVFNNGAVVKLETDSTLTFVPEGATAILFVGDTDNPNAGVADTKRGGTFEVYGTFTGKQVNVTSDGKVTVGEKGQFDVRNLILTSNFINRACGVMTIKDGGKASSGMVSIGDDAVLTITGADSTLLVDNFATTQKGYFKNNGTTFIKNGASLIYDLTYPGQTKGNDGGVTNSSVISIEKGTLDVTSVVGIINNGTITVNGGTLDVDLVEWNNAYNYGITNSGTITVKGNSTINATISDGGKVVFANKSEVSGKISADITVEGTASLAADTKFSGSVDGKNLKISGAGNTLDITGGTGTLLLAAGTVLGDNAETEEVEVDKVGNIAIKGATTNAEVTIEASALEGNKISNARVNFTNVGSEINADIDLAAIKSINGIAVNSIGGMYFFSTTEGQDIKTYILNRENGKVSIALADGSSPVENELGNFTVKDSYTVATDITMASGKTTIKVNKGKADQRLTFAISNINKSENGGTNELSFGNYTDITTGDVASLGNLTIGKDSTATVGALNGQNLSQTIKVGAGSTLTSEAIDLAGGTNKISVGAKAGMTVNGNVDGVSSLTLANGTFDKKSGNTVWTTATINGVYNAATRNNKITVGNYAKLFINETDAAGHSICNGGVTSGTGTTIKLGKGSYMDVAGAIDGLSGLNVGAESTFESGAINGTFKNNKISVSSKAKSFSAGTIDLKGGKNSFIVGSDVQNVSVDSLKNVQTVTIGARSKANIGSIADVQNLKVSVSEFNTTSLNAASVTGTEKNDTITLDNYATANLGEVNFGDGKDTLKLGKGSRLTVTDIKGMDVFNASKGAVLKVLNGDVDVDMTGVTGSWQNAEIYDMQGVLNTGVMNVEDAVYANEYDVFSYSGALQFSDIGADTKIEWSANGGLSWNVYNVNTSLNDGNYMIRVSSTGDYSDKYDKNGYSFTAIA